MLDRFNKAQCKHGEYLILCAFHFLLSIDKSFQDDYFHHLSLSKFNCSTFCQWYYKSWNVLCVTHNGKMHAWERPLPL